MLFTLIMLTTKKILIKSLKNLSRNDLKTLVNISISSRLTTLEGEQKFNQPNAVKNFTFENT